MKVLFVGNCLPFFPSGIVRGLKYFPLFRNAGITPSWISVNSATVQRLLGWLDTVIPNRKNPIGYFLRVLFHLPDIAVGFVAYIRVLAVAGKVERIVFQSVVPPVWVLFLLKRINPFFVFDFDDAIYVRHRKKTENIIRQAWKIFAGSHALLEFSHRYNEAVILLPSTVDLEKFGISAKGKQPLRIGWLGSVSTRNQLDLLITPLSKLTVLGYQFEFVVMGANVSESWNSLRRKINVRSIPSYTDDEIPGLVSAIDIGVMPLYDTEAERGKCALKLIIYMAAGKAAVSSAVGEAVHIIEDGINGLLAADEDDWVRHLRHLLDSETFRAQLGREGRQTVGSRYTLETGFTIFKNALFGDSVADGE
ncbi:MAG: glycosyltransferase family 4 protein [Chloroflexi bacterium]|nr:glycosyltransferase family 4 protein [Chloroflexota bacterium]